MQKILTADTIAVADSSGRVVAAKRVLSSRVSYRPRCSEVRYSDSELSIAQNLALEGFGELSHRPIRKMDEHFFADSSTKVLRYELEDGSVGYFKPFTENSFNEHDFRDYSTTSLGASINEVNAYRMAQLLGGGFSDLVPETVLREIDGSLGTLQREVVSEGEPPSSFHRNPQLREDYRKAAIFDFVIGNLDRHSDNFIYGFEGAAGGRRRYRIRLIDHSFSFPWRRSTVYFNRSIFADNSAPGDIFDSAGYRVPQTESGLKADERISLTEAKAGVERCISEGTIGARRSKAVLCRINVLLKSDRLRRLCDYFDTY